MAPDVEQSFAEISNANYRAAIAYIGDLVIQSPSAVSLANIAMKRYYAEEKKPGVALFTNITGAMTIAFIAGTRYRGPMPLPTKRN